MSTTENTIIQEDIFEYIKEKYPHLPDRYVGQITEIVFHRLDENVPVSAQIDLLIDNVYA